MTPKAVKRRQKLKQQRAEAIAATGEKGSAIHYGAVLVGEDLEGAQVWAHLELDESELLSFLRAQAHKALPPATRYEIRKAVPMHFGRQKGMAWYSVPTMTAIADWADGGPGNATGPVECTIAPEGGYYLIGRFTTPRLPGAVADGAKH